MNNQAIGIFDSGLGGLNSVKEIKNLLPHESVIYFGDTARTPYGSKSIETINRFAREIVRFLLSKQVKMIAIACNTVSSASLSRLQETFPDVPFIGIIEPMVGVLPQMIKEPDPKFLIIGTEVTIQSRMYQEKIRSYFPKAKILAKSCPLFVSLIEQGLIDDPVMDTVIHEYLDQIIITEKPDYLILGCTHYPLIAHRLSEFYPQLRQFNPSISQAAAIRDYLAEHDLTAEENHAADYAFFASDLSPLFREMIYQIIPDQILTFKELKL